MTIRNTLLGLFTYYEQFIIKETNQARPAEFDTNRIYAWLVSTSGSTGIPKVAAFRHRPLINQIIGLIGLTGNSRESGRVLHLAPVQWISSFFNALVPFISQHCKLHTSKPDDIEHYIDIINKYKPISLMSGPSTISNILNHEKKCDLTCFNVITLLGSKIYKELMMELKSRTQGKAMILEAYGQTETMGPVLRPNPMGPEGCCGVYMPPFEIKLVEPETGKEITEPKVPGELWVKGPCFAEYYNNPKETANAFTEDGWYKTGDLLQRDENGNYFFVDRIKMLIKYKNYHVNPPELEELISSLEGVLDVAVLGVPHPADGQRPLACVVRRPGWNVTAQEIKDIVASKLSASKQLRGGVVFLDELPMTSTGKVARGKLNDIVSNSHKEL